ncbi:unnamed protein product, partial [Closterium sp. NIES-54]
MYLASPDPLSPVPPLPVCPPPRLPSCAHRSTCLSALPPACLPGCPHPPRVFTHHQSLHPAAEFHAAARAVGGCAVYVSDKPGQHDFSVLRKLVLPDGSVLRAKLPGRPTRDCLFADPARDHTSMLKIWTMNACSGMVGAFNCQGAGWCRDGRKYTMHNPDPDAVTGTVAAADVDLLADVAAGDWTGDVVVFSHNA